MLLRKNTLIMVILIQIVPSVLIIEDARIVILIADHVVLYMKKDIQWVYTIEEKKMFESVYSKESEEYGDVADFIFE